MAALQMEDGYRPGFAKRADNFTDVCNLAIQWEYQSGLTCGRLKDAIAVGTPSLNMGERCVLGAYATFLNQESLERGMAYVWPSAKLIARLLGCSESSVRGYRKSLEAKGFMVRDYNQANRPAGKESLNLAPTAARLEELEQHEFDARESVREEREAWMAHVVDLGIYRAQAPGNRRLEQSQGKIRYPVETADAPTARSTVETRRAPPDEAGSPTSQRRKHRNSPDASAICSPGGASGFSGARLPPPVTDEMAFSELSAAIELLPDLAELVPAPVRENPGLATAADVERWTQLAQRLMPEGSRNNDRTFQWAYRNHGIRALTMLAIALADPEVDNPCRYFGWMAKQDPRGAPDLRLNLQRIGKARGLSLPPIVEMAPARAPATSLPAPPPAATTVQPPPGADDPTWQAIAKRIHRAVGMGAFGSWFAGVGFHGITDGVLSISAATATARAQIERSYRSILLDAARSAGLEVSRVVISLRKSDPAAGLQ